MATIAPAKKRPARDGVVTRAGILDAAERLFAQHGLRATRTEDIAARSGVTKAMIHYYFATKENLYQSVLDRVFRERADGLDFPSLPHLEPVAALHAFVERLLGQMCRKPHLGPLFALENVQNDGAYYNRQGGEIYRVITDIIERGVADGSFRPLEPRHAAINVMGACIHYFNVSANVRTLWSENAQDHAALMRDHARSAADFVTAALCARGTARSRQPSSLAAAR